MSMPEPPHRQPHTVLMALSGGVDSSVAAHLLQRQGCELIAVTLRMDEDASNGEDGGSSCGGGSAIDSARRAADSLGIRHVVIDARKEFESQVLRPSWDAYARGETPSPCILCNERIKFGLLLQKAAALGADKVATGHYARIQRDALGIPHIARGTDPAKDQAYFLFALSPAQLEKVLFPLGELSKTEVRGIAAAIGLSTADRKDSQDACFALSPEGFAESLRLKFGAPAACGPVLDGEGRILRARHGGLHRFTIGQRRGFGFSVGQKAFVRALRPEDSAVILTWDESDLLTREMRVRCAPGGLPALQFRCEVQIRSRHRAAPAEVEALPSSETSEGIREARVIFDAPQRAVTPGQAAVFFQGGMVVGGGWIQRN